jgi:hypothetical protein
MHLGSMNYLVGIYYLLGLKNIQMHKQSIEFDWDSWCMMIDNIVNLLDNLYMCTGSLGMIDNLEVSNIDYML